MKEKKDASLVRNLILVPLGKDPERDELVRAAWSSEPYTVKEH